MSWEPLNAPAPKAAVAPVTLTMTVLSEGAVRPRRPHATLIFRDRDIIALPWLVPGFRVNLMLGRADHAGKLRIVPGGAETVKTVRAGRGPKWTAIVSPVLAAALLEGARGRALSFRAEACEYDFGDEWIEIELPRVALGADFLRDGSAPRAAGFTPLPGATATAVPTKGVPFRGIASRTGVAASPNAGKAPL